MLSKVSLCFDSVLIYHDSFSMRTLLQTGVLSGYTLPIKLVGVGYRAALERNKLQLRLGYANPVEIEIPSDIKVTVPTPQRIIVQGIDLQRVTQFAAGVRKWRKPEPYNQKGVFVGDETIKKKEGKKR